MKLEFSRHIIEKYPNIKFHENPSSWNGVVPYGRTDMKKLIVAFRNFAKVPTNTSQSDIKKTARNLEFSAEIFSATRTETVLSVLSVGMQIAP
jgi:hypothetical protein